MKKVVLSSLAVLALLLFVGALFVHAQPPGLQKYTDFSTWIGETAPAVCKPGDMYITSTQLKFCKPAGNGLLPVIDNSSVVGAQTPGVTASGATCTITAITNGVITAASCM